MTHPTISNQTVMLCRLVTANPGDKVWFVEERQGYTIQAMDDRYVICTKPFNLHKTVLYSIIDIHQAIRSTEAGWSRGFETVADCEAALDRLIRGETYLSRRQSTALLIDDIQKVE